MYQVALTEDSAAKRQIVRRLEAQLAELQRSDDPRVREELAELERQMEEVNRLHHAIGGHLCFACAGIACAPDAGSMNEDDGDGSAAQA